MPSSLLLPVAFSAGASEEAPTYCRFALTLLFSDREVGHGPRSHCTRTRRAGSGSRPIDLGAAAARFGTWSSRRLPLSLVAEGFWVLRRCLRQCMVLTGLGGLRERAGAWCRLVRTSRSDALAMY